MQLTGYIGWRHDDNEGLLGWVDFWGEVAFVKPELVEPLLHTRRVVGFREIPFRSCGGHYVVEALTGKTIAYCSIAINACLNETCIERGRTLNGCTLDFLYRSYAQIPSGV